MKLRKIVTGGLLVGLGAVLGPQIASAAIHATNTCEGCTATSGDAKSKNNNTSNVGPSSGPGGLTVQVGDNSNHGHQNASAISGDANAGQVVGSAGGGAGGGSNSIVASNACTDCNATSGDAKSKNNNTSNVGPSSGPGGTTVQDGNNSNHSHQDSNAQSGDANSGQVVGQSG